MKTNNIIIIIAFIAAFFILGLSEMIGKYKENQSIELRDFELSTKDSITDNSQ